MRLFFYGTLMDPDVQNVVLGRVVPDEHIEAGVAEGFRCVFVAGRSYPMLLPYAAGRVEGHLVHGLDRDAVRRLTAYEGREYHLVPLRVKSLDHGQTVTAGIFLTDRTIRPDRRDWSLALWQLRYKRGFLRHARQLMHRYGSIPDLRTIAGSPVMPVLSRKDPKLLHGKPPLLGRVG